MKRILAGGKQKLDKMQMQQEEKQDRKNKRDQQKETKAERKPAETVTGKA